MKPRPPHPPNFDPIARAYRWLEYCTLGRALERLRLHHLPTLAQRASPPAYALILGDGDGRFTARLLAAQPGLRADAVDLSREMLRLLEARCRALAPDTRERLTLHRQDALQFASRPLPPRAYDLVVTHFFLDCLDQMQVEQLLHHVTPAIRPGGLWLVSEFRIPPGVLHWPARLYVRGLYLIFRLLTGLETTRLPDHRAALAHAGFTNLSTHHALFGLLTTELWSAPASQPRA